MADSTNHVYVIAEAGVNHNGDRQMAIDLVHAAAECGADAVKFQTFDAKLLTSPDAPKAKYQAAGDNKENQRSMLEALELPLDWHAELKELAESKGIEFLTTAFDPASLEFVVSLGVSRLKVPSGELNNAPFLWQIARTDFPLLVSTGMANLGEVEQALAIIAHARTHAEEPGSLQQVWEAWSRPDVRAKASERLTLLHCTSQYPAPLAEVELKAMDQLAAAFSLPVGYSDHTSGTIISVAAAARGATVIEKHFTLDRALPGPDHAASLVPGELRDMIAGIRDVSLALGSGLKAPQASEWDTRRVAQQQVVAARDLPAQHRLCREDLTTARCGAGIAAAMLWDTVGTTTSRAFRKGEAIEP